MVSFFNAHIYNYSMSAIYMSKDKLTDLYYIVYTYAK